MTDFMIREATQRLAGREVPLRAFDWNPKDRTLVAEASDLKFVNGFGGFQIHRLWPDACDTGIAIRSHHTGKVEVFVLDRIDRKEDEVHGWWFLPLDMESKVSKVLIIND